MVKFGDHLLSNLVVEWSSKYLNYKKLKKLLKAIRNAREAIRIQNQEGGKVFENRSVVQSPANTTKTVVVIEPLAADDQSTDEQPTGATTTTGAKGSLSPRHRSAMTHTVPTPQQLAVIAAMPEDQQFRQLQLLGTVNEQPGLATDVTNGQSVVDVSLHPEASLEDLVPSGTECEVEERAFFAKLQSELTKIDSFYGEKERSFLNQCNSLVRQLNAISQAPPPTKLTARMQLEKKKEILQKACGDLYRGLDFLKNFRILNYTGFVKILKKHDKRSAWTSASKPVLARVVHSPFFTSELTTIIQSKLEELYVRSFTKGDHSKAMVKLRPVVHKTSHWTTFGLGLEVGLIICLFLVLFIMAGLTENFSGSKPFKATFPVFRCVAVLIIHIWCWGAVVWAYSTFRVNYVFILEADPQNYLRYSEIFQLAGLSSVLFLFALVFFYFVWTFGSNGEPWLAHPEYIHFVFWIVAIALMLNPFNVMCRSTRWFALRAIGDIMVSPFAFVDFKSFFIADHLTSLVRAILDMAYSICFYTTGAFITNESAQCSAAMLTARWVISPLPHFWRLLQCLRRYYDGPQRSHLYNACKYTCSILVTYSSLIASVRPEKGYLYFWICCAVVSTIFSSYWDIKFDWGLAVPGSPNKWLRTNLTIPEHQWVYFVAAALDVVLRVAWVITISPGTFGLGINPDFLLLVLASLESFRRNMWSYFRMENEHLNNCGQFRAIKQVPLLMDNGDQLALMGPATTKKDKKSTADKDKEKSVNSSPVKASRRPSVQHTELPRPLTGGGSRRPSLKSKPPSPANGNDGLATRTPAGTPKVLPQQILGLHASLQTLHLHPSSSSSQLVSLPPPLPKTPSSLQMPSLPSSLGLTGDKDSSMLTTPPTTAHGQPLPAETTASLARTSSLGLPTIHEPSSSMDEAQLLMIREGQPDVMAPLSILAAGASSSPPLLTPPSPNTLSQLDLQQQQQSALLRSDFRSPPLETPTSMTTPLTTGSGSQGHHAHRFSRSVLPPLQPQVSMASLIGSPVPSVPPSANGGSVRPRFHDEIVAMTVMTNNNASSATHHLRTMSSLQPPPGSTFVNMTAPTTDVPSSSSTLPPPPPPHPTLTLSTSDAVPRPPTVSPAGITIRPLNFIPHDPTTTTNITPTAASASTTASSNDSGSNSNDHSHSNTLVDAVDAAPIVTNVTTTTQNTNNGETLPRSILPRVESSSYIAAMAMAMATADRVTSPNGNNLHTNLRVDPTHNNGRRPSFAYAHIDNDEVFPLRRKPSSAVATPTAGAVELKYMNPTSSIMDDDIANGDARTVTHAGSAAGLAAMSSHHRETKMKEFYPHNSTKGGGAAKRDSNSDDDDDDEDHHDDDDNEHDGEADELIHHHDHGPAATTGLVRRNTSNRVVVAETPVGQRGPNWVDEIQYVAALRPPPRTPNIKRVTSTNSVASMIHMNNTMNAVPQTPGGISRTNSGIRMNSNMLTTPPMGSGGSNGGSNNPTAPSSRAVTPSGAASVAAGSTLATAGSIIGVPPRLPSKPSTPQHHTMIA